MKWQKVIVLCCLFALLAKGVDHHIGQSAAQPVSSEEVLRYGTYLGGSLWDEAYAVASDAEGNIYLVGHTQSSDFPTTNASRINRHLDVSSKAHAIEAFIAKINPKNGELAYMVLIPSSVEEFAEDIVVDKQGYAYVVGRTDSPDFPTTAGAFDTTHSGTFDFDAFVVKIDPQGEVVYSTFLGSSGSDDATGIAIDDAGNAYVSGGTWATDFPVTSDAYDATHNGQRDLFLAKLNADGSDIEYATFVGGSSQEQAEDLALDQNGAVYLTGWTRSEDFPTTDGVYESQYNGGFEAFAIKISLDSSATAKSRQLDYVTFLGGSGEDRGFTIAVDADGQAVLSGLTASSDFPTTKGAFNRTYGGGTCQFAACPDAFVSKLSPDGVNLLYSGYLGGTSWDQANSMAIDHAGTVYVTGQTLSADFPTTANAYDASLGGQNDAFVAQINASGSRLLYATYLGGTLQDDGSGIALDPAGRVYVTGKTLSNDFPTTATAYGANLNADYDAFGVILDLPTPTTSQEQPVELFLPLILNSSSGK